MGNATKTCIEDNGKAPDKRFTKIVMINVIQFGLFQGKIQLVNFLSNGGYKKM